MRTRHVIKRTDQFGQRCGDRLRSHRTAHAFPADHESEGDRAFVELGGQQLNLAVGYFN
jgi:hypothetical protein